MADLNVALTNRLEEALRLAWGSLAAGGLSSFEQRMAVKEIQRLNADLRSQYRARVRLEIKSPEPVVQRPKLRLVG